MSGSGGGRFADGPAEALAKLSRVRPLRLAARALRHRRFACPRARAARGGPAHRGRADPHDRRTRPARGGRRRRLLRRHHRRRGRTPPWSAACWSGSAPTSAANCVPGGPGNDQVATLFRMYLRDHARTVGGLIADLQDALVGPAEAHPDVAMPGRTHLQHAQPVLFAHHVLSPTSRRCPGTRSGCASGTSAPPCRRTARAPWPVPARPGIRRRSRRTSASSTAAPATPSTGRPRDFVAGFAFITAMIGVNVSRIAEEIIIWNTKEFSFVTLHDAFSTGSSIMPQKKNPDIAELAQRQVRPSDRQPHRPDGHPQGPPARVQPRPPGGQGARLRLHRPAGGPAPRLTGMMATLTVHRERMEEPAPARSRSPPTSPSGWSSRACRSASRTRWPGECVKAAEAEGKELDELTDEQFAKISAHLTPRCAPSSTSPARSPPAAAARYGPQRGRRPARRGQGGRGRPAPRANAK